MLKNIEICRTKGITIKKEFLKPELYAFQIPPAILKGLNLRNIGEKPSRRKRGRSNSITKQSTLKHKDSQDDNTLSQRPNGSI